MTYFPILYFIVLTLVMCHVNFQTFQTKIIQGIQNFIFQLPLCLFYHVLCTVVAGTNVSRDPENKTATVAALLVGSQ